jgi:serine protease Do
MHRHAVNQLGWRRIRRFWHFSAAIGLGLAVSTAQSAKAEPRTVTASGQVSLRFNPVVQAIQNAEPAVVNIQGNKTIASTSGSSSGAKQEVNGMGTGVIIDSRGYIITNLHVVQDVSKIEVTLADGTKTEARLINYDPQTDLAMIRIQVNRSLPVIPIGSSHDLMRGETVIAIGNPFGYQHTVTVGVVSALHRNIPVNGTQEYHDLIQTNADINPGNSGGPLVNIDGEVIGINVAVRVGAQGIGFAIPIDAACEVIADLVADAQPQHFSHGLQLETLHEEDGTYTRIADAVTPASTDHRLQSGDVLVSFAGQPIRHRMDVELCLLGRRNGEEVDVIVERSGRTVNSRLRLDGASSTAPSSSMAQEAWDKLGIRLSTVSKHALQKVGDEYTGGLKVLEVRTGSPAANEGIIPGDIIIGILRWQTPNMQALQWVLNSDEFNESASAKFVLVRNNEKYWAAMKVSRSSKIR